MPTAEFANGGISARAIAQELEALAAAGLTHLPRAAALGSPLPETPPREPAQELPPREAAQETPPREPAQGLPLREPATSQTMLEEPAVRDVQPSSPRLPALPAVPPVPARTSPPVVDGATLFDAPKTAEPPASFTDRVAGLQLIQREVAACMRCADLCHARTQTVFGVGSPQARLVFLGEAPGADEDAQGEPFVGRAGQLLTKIIEACRMNREDVYILNILKCRPPGNRNPAPDEMANCRGYLDRQLEIIRPEFICCLGSVAAKALLATETSIGKLRGRFYRYNGAEVLCTYHPAFLLRNPSAKREVWDDMKLLMGRMGVELG